MAENKHNIDEQMFMATTHACIKEMIGGDMISVPRRSQGTFCKSQPIMWSPSLELEWYNPSTLEEREQNRALFRRLRVIPFKG